MHLNSNGLSAGRYRSISAKLNLALMAAVTVTFLIAGTLLNAWLSQRLESRGLAELKRTNQQVVDMVDAYSGALEQSAKMMGAMFQATLPKNLAVDAEQKVKTGAAELPALKAGGLTLNNEFTLVDQFTATTGGVATLFVRDGDDFFRATTSLKNPQGERVIGTNLGSKHPGYAKLMAGQPYVGPALLFGRNYMTSYVPISNSEGKVIAISFIGVDFTEGLKALKSRVLALKIGERGYSFVVDAVKQPGLAIIHPAAEGKNLIDTKDQNGVEVIRRLIEMKSGELRYWWQNPELGDTVAREKITVVAPFDKWGWIVATGTDLEELNREVAIVRMHLLTTGLVILAVLAATIFWTTRRWISRPLAAAVSATQSVAEGDLTRQIAARSNDEVGVLLGSLDTMARHLRQMVKEIDGGIRHLAGNAEQLANASDVVSKASEEQSAAASSMAATVEEMTTSIGHVAAHAESCQQMATRSGEVSESGSQVIRQAVDGMTEIAATVVQSSVAVGHLGDESQQISQIVNVIREIADQTNLLALNAAIEAARAGEAGRGFAVVADEVRKLAERTTQSTQEITGMVNRIQQGAADAVQRMRQGEGQVTAGVSLANAAGQRIDEIKAGADDVSRAVTAISDALQEQNVANLEIARNVEQIAQQAERNFSQARTTADTAHEMKTLSEQLRAGIARFRT